MIKKYQFGKPFNTDAVVKDLTISNDLTKLIIIKDKELFIKLNNDSKVYGLGQALRGINKRGYIYRSFAIDDPVHSEDKLNLYGAHNFIVIELNNNYLGLFIDTPSMVTFDIGYTNSNELKITIDNNNYCLYVLENTNLYNLIIEFRKLIGKPYLPPKWGLGYGQSRWSYNSAKEVLDIAKLHKENNLPLDLIYLDIDYMDNFKNFTLSKDFKDLKELVNKLKKDNIHLVPIIDARVKVEKDYPIYEEGIKNNYFLTNKDNTPFIGGVWPGLSVYPDFLRPDVRTWFASKFKIFTDIGINSFWFDMNEPSIFYSKNNVDQIINNLNNKKTPFNLGDILSLQGELSSLHNRVDDYKNMYHHIDNKAVSNYILHNIYGMNMTKALGEYFQNNNEDYFLFARGSYIGAHRYAGIWQGDNYSTYQQLEYCIYQAINLNMVGFLFNGADLGGFAGNTTPDLILRWLEFAIFCPLLRNHSAKFTRYQELYRFDNLASLREILKLRYSLLEYIYDELEYARDNNLMYLRPMSFDYPDDKILREINDQVMVGRKIMIAPIYKQNQNYRYVYLPERYKQIRLRAYNDFDQDILDKGHHYIEVKPNELLIFIKEKDTLYLNTPQSNTTKLINDHIIKL